MRRAEQDPSSSARFASPFANLSQSAAAASFLSSAAPFASSQGSGGFFSQGSGGFFSRASQSSSQGKKQPTRCQFCQSSDLSRPDDDDGESDVVCNRCGSVVQRGNLRQEHIELQGNEDDGGTFQGEKRGVKAWRSTYNPLKAPVEPVIEVKEKKKAPTALEIKDQKQKKLQSKAARLTDLKMDSTNAALKTLGDLGLASSSSVQRRILTSINLSFVDQVKKVWSKSLPFYSRRVYHILTVVLSSLEKNNFITFADAILWARCGLVPKAEIMLDLDTRVAIDTLREEYEVWSDVHQGEAEDLHAKGKRDLDKQAVVMRLCLRVGAITKMDFVLLWQACWIVLFHLNKVSALTDCDLPGLCIGVVFCIPLISHWRSHIIKLRAKDLEPGLAPIGRVVLGHSLEELAGSKDKMARYKNFLLSASLEKSAKRIKLPDMPADIGAQVTPPPLPAGLWDARPCPGKCLEAFEKELVGESSVNRVHGGLGNSLDLAELAIWQSVLKLKTNWDLVNVDLNRLVRFASDLLQISENYVRRELKGLAKSLPPLADLRGCDYASFVSDSKRLCSLGCKGVFACI